MQANCTFKPRGKLREYLINVRIYVYIVYQCRCIFTGPKKLRALVTACSVSNNVQAPSWKLETK